MKAVVVTTPGGPEVLQVQEVDDPQINEDEVLIKICATALNRADTLQRQGKYPPPKGAPPYPGLECSGVIEAVGKNVDKWKVGDQVCALLGGGGYAEKVAVHSGHVLPVPKGVSLQEAAALPEVSCTVWSTVFMTSHLSPGENFLVHGSSSGIGTFAIQIAKHIGAKVFVTSGSEEKLNCCEELGADVAINYKTEDFVSRVKEETGGKGGSVTEINLSSVLARRLTIQAAGLRTRTVENKAHIIADVQKHVWPTIEEGKVKPVVYVSPPLSQVAESHRIMESSSHIGKILLTT